MALNPRLRDWRGRVVWIVGGSTGIGHATAARLHAAGAQVIVSARSAPALAEFERTHPGSLGVPMDVSDREAVLRATDTVMARCGRLDLVFVCSGHYRPQRATAFDLDEALRHLQVNYVGVLQVLDAVLPELLRQGHGHLSLAGSVSGYRGLPQALALWPDQGRADQSGRGVVPGPAARRPRGVHRQPRLCRHPPHSPECLPNAGPDQRRHRRYPHPARVGGRAL